MFRYSFDVSDTLRTRTLLSPLDVFRSVQHRLLSNKCSYADIPEGIIKSFVPARIWMEFKARRQSSRETMRLFWVSPLFVREFALAPGRLCCLVEPELAVERLCSVPVGHNCRKVSRLRETSPSMDDVSEMQTPPAFIKELLETSWSLAGRRQPLCLRLDRLYQRGHGKSYRHSGSRGRQLPPLHDPECADKDCRGPW